MHSAWQPRTRVEGSIKEGLATAGPPAEMRGKVRSQAERSVEEANQSAARWQTGPIAAPARGSVAPLLSVIWFYISVLFTSRFLISLSHPLHFLPLFSTAVRLVNHVIRPHIQSNPRVYTPS